MKPFKRPALFSLSALCIIPAVLAGEPKAVRTEVLGPWVGEEAPLHPDNLVPHPIRFYGTDLGWTYEHDGRLQLLFGDTMAAEKGGSIETYSGNRLDDSYGTVDLSAWPDPANIRAGNLPPVRIGQNPNSAEAAAIDPGVALEGFKTPVGGFSNGRHEFGLFYTGKPAGCAADGDCANHLSCDAGLGYAGEPYDQFEGQTYPCLDGSSPFCHADTVGVRYGEPVPGSGLCVDEGSTIRAPEGFGRISAVGLRMLVGMRDSHDPKRYIETTEWLTNRFLNLSVRTVQDFDPARESAQQDYSAAQAGGENRKVFIWGRPAFMGVKARNRPAAQYFAYVDMPRGRAYDWHPRYFAGLDEDGRPRFSAVETDAAPLDLDANAPGVQYVEEHDVVNQVSVAWVEPLRKWVMFYGGGVTVIPYPPMLANCGVLEFFTGPECSDVVIGDGAFHMRTADHPWGPWSPPQDLIAGGDPDAGPAGQYGVGGMLRHPDCAEPGCAPHTDARDVNRREYGFFYSANIIEQWTRPAGDGVDIIWNASTWDPYRIILLRTRIEP
jgi:hypothetical protein